MKVTVQFKDPLLPMILCVLNEKEGKILSNSTNFNFVSAKDHDIATGV